MGSLSLQLWVWERQIGLLNRQGSQANCRSTCHRFKASCQDKYRCWRIWSCFRGFLAWETYSKKSTSHYWFWTSKMLFKLSDLAGGSRTSRRAYFLQGTLGRRHFHLSRLVCRRNLSAIWLLHHHRPPRQNTIRRRIRGSWSYQDNHAMLPHLRCTQARLYPRNLGNCVHSCMVWPQMIAVRRHLGYFCRFLILHLRYPRLGIGNSHLTSWHV